MRKDHQRPDNTGAQPALAGLSIAGFLQIFGPQRKPPIAFVWFTEGYIFVLLFLVPDEEEHVAELPLYAVIFQRRQSRITRPAILLKTQ